MSQPLIADTGGLLRALARKSNGKPSFPEYETALTSASLVIVPALVLAEIDYFLSNERAAMRKLIVELFDPRTTYEYEFALPSDVVRALELDAKFKELDLGLVDGAPCSIGMRPHASLSERGQRLNDRLRVRVSGRGHLLRPGELLSR